MEKRRVRQMGIALIVVLTFTPVGRTMGAPSSSGAVLLTPAHLDSGTIHAVATERGLEVTLTLPQRVYPRDALAVVSVAEKNVTRARRRVPAGGRLICSGALVSVLSGRGTNLYPPVLPDEPGVYCLPRFPAVSLAPGQTYRWSQPVILRGSIIRLRNLGRLEGPALHVSLAAAHSSSPLHVAIGLRPHLEAIVHAARIRHIFYYQWTACHTDGLVSYYVSPHWFTVGPGIIHPLWNPPDSAPPLSPVCDGSRRVWHFVVGVPGQRVSYQVYDR